MAVTDNIMVIYRNMNHIIMTADSVPSISLFGYPSTVSYLDIKLNKMSKKFLRSFQVPSKTEILSRHKCFSV